MNCLEFRRAIAIDPNDPRAELAAHRAECARCAAAYDEAQAFERQLASALAIPVPHGLADRILLAQTTAVAREHGGSRAGSSATAPRRALALRWAAGFLIAAGLGALLLRDDRVQPLPFAQAATEHVRHESASLSAWTKIEPTAVDTAFAQGGVELASPPSDVNYLTRCPLHGQTVVHMVTQRPEGPVTVFYFPKRADAPKTFENDGFVGRATDLGAGTLVLVASDGAGFDALERQWADALGVGTGDAVGAP